MLQASRPVTSFRDLIMDQKRFQSLKYSVVHTRNNSMFESLTRNSSQDHRWQTETKTLLPSTYCQLLKRFPTHLFLAVKAASISNADNALYQGAKSRKDVAVSSGITAFQDQLVSIDTEVSLARVLIEKVSTGRHPH